MAYAFTDNRFSIISNAYISAIYLDVSIFVLVRDYVFSIPDIDKGDFD